MATGTFKKISGYDFVKSVTLSLPAGKFVSLPFNRNSNYLVEVRAVIDGTQKYDTSWNYSCVFYSDTVIITFPTLDEGTDIIIKYM